MKRALITGISGQDGSYLTEYLLDLGYEVYGLVRREPGALRHLESVRNRIEFLSGDMRHGASLAVAFQKSRPDEVYNLAGQIFSTIEDCVEVNPNLLRTGETRDLHGDTTLTRHELGWKAEMDFPGLVRMMLRADVEALRR